MENELTIRRMKHDDLDSVLNVEKKIIYNSVVQTDVPG